MTIKQNAPSGQETRDPSPVDILDKHTRALVRITAVLTKLSGRLDAIERRLGAVEQTDVDDEDTAVDDEPLREPAEEDDVVAFAIGIDGRAIVEINYFDNEDVIDRKGWTGIILDETETAELLTFLGDGASDAAARFGGHLRATRKKATSGNDNSEQGGAP